MIKRAYIKHIASHYPEKIVHNDPNGRLTSKIGVYSYHYAREDECASDLGVLAAEKLFKQYNIDRDSIDGIILCTQAVDYIMPSTACVMQGRLNLRDNILAFDITQGCAGYPYSLSVAKGFIETGMANNILLINADTLSKVIHQGDMRTKPIFGDSAAATLISGKYSRKEFLSNFKFGTNGKDYHKIIIHYGGTRMKYTDRELAYKDIYDQFGNARNDAHVYMDGKSVMQFTQKVVPIMMHEILESARLNISDIDNFIFHQANKMMLEGIQKACNIPDDGRYWNDISDIGNTTHASIPNAINRMQKRDIKLGQRTLFMGFGVGLSWSGCIADLSMIDNEE